LDLPPPTTPPDGVSGDAIAALEKKLENEKDLRREERFIWIVMCMILTDIIWLRSSSNASLAIVVLVLESVILVVLARRLGIEQIPEYINKFADKFMSNGG
jgi:hypothetical protein